MLTPSSDVQARLSALEEYIEMPAERTGMTVTSRLTAQHNLLLAFRAEFNVFRDQTNQRLTALEDMLGQVLHGMTEIKRLLAPGSGSP